MDRRRIARLIRVQERVYRAQRGEALRAQAALRLATTQEERTRALHRIQAHTLCKQHSWSAGELARAAELADLTRTAVVTAGEERAERARVVEQAQAELQALSSDLRRLQEVQRRLVRTEQARAARAEQRMQDEVAARMWRHDADPE